MPCDCININIISFGEPVNVQLVPNGIIVNGAPQFENVDAGAFIEWDSINSRWIIYGGDDDAFAFYSGVIDECPFGTWEVVEGNPNGVTFTEATECFTPAPICDCIQIEIIIEGQSFSVQLFPNGNIVGGVSQFEAPFFETDIFIEYDSINSRWIVYVGDDPFFAFYEGTNEICPFGIWAVVPNEFGLSFVQGSICGVIPPPLCCVRVCMQDFGRSNPPPPEECKNLEASGIFNGKPYYQFNLYGENFELIFNDVGPSWNIDNIAVIGQPPNNGAQWFKSKSSFDCPIGIIFTSTNDEITDASTSFCIQCVPVQERTKKEYQSVRLPKIFTEEKRGFDRCCCDALVLASQTNDSWKNDITSAWIKVADINDVTNFNLYKNGVLANYQPTINIFVKEPLARYVTINWKDVLALDGEGCYKLEIAFSIAGINQTMIWGKYTLKNYSINAALGTARVRVIFNSFQEIEGIDFTDSLVEDSLRFNGFIGNSQPNTEIDNLIYADREVKKVIRENLKSYELITDPICEEFTKSLTDLYLLSENQIFLSDYNAHNHSYRYQDLPAIVEKSPEIEYYDFSRSAKLTCILGDKFKNQRSYFK